MSETQNVSEKMILIIQFITWRSTVIQKTLLVLQVRKVFIKI